MEPAILLEDDSIIVVDKPAGMIVHDGKESLSAWLIRHDPNMTKQDWPDPQRPGIVHRLDQGTSGVMVLAKTPEVLEKLQKQFREHIIKKIYLTIVFNHPVPEQGSVDVPIGRHPGRKTPMSVIPIEEVARGKVRPASTDYKVIEKFRDASLVEATIHTGRTHQIRLHMKYIGHPILGDGTYQTKSSRNLSKSLAITRQMLHAKSLSLHHPESGKPLRLDAPLPYDMRNTLAQLRPKG